MILDAQTILLGSIHIFSFESDNNKASVGDIMPCMYLDLPVKIA